MPRLPLILAFCLLPLAGCASPTPQLTLPPAALTEVSEFPGASTILTGFDLAPTRLEWSVGDQVLVGIRATKPSGTTTRLLLVELTSELDTKTMNFTTRDSKRGPYSLESPVAITNLTLYDETGKQLDTAKGRFATNFLGYGVFDGAAVYADHPELNGDPKDLPPMTDEEFDHSMRGWLTLMAFSGSMNKRGMFKAMLEDIVARPTWLAMIFNPSISLTFNDGTWPARESPWVPEGSSSAGIPSIRLPMQMTIAGKVAMTGVMHCAEPVAPLSLCGGLTTAKGWNGDDPNTRIEIRLLACKRGTGGRTFKEAAK